MSMFDEYPRGHPAFNTLLDALLSDRCWQCDETKAQGKCPDCGDPGEWCGDCLVWHQATKHGTDLEHGGKQFNLRKEKEV